MKKLLLALLILSFSPKLFAQSINDTPFEKIEGDYISIISNQNESDVYIDFGTRYNAPRFNNRLAAPEHRNIIKNKDGVEMICSDRINRAERNQNRWLFRLPSLLV